MNSLNICFCSDVNLIKFIPTVINSILRKNSNYKINIHYIHNIDDDIKINNLKKDISKYDNLTLFSYYKTWDRQYIGLKHVSIATMLRLFIPEIIKCDKLIYLDIDIIVNLNLHELLNIDCGKTGIAIKNSIYQKWEKFFDDKSGKKSGNCGVIVMNLETLRKNNFTQKCLEIHSKNQNRHDQYVINMYANGNHTVLEPRLNIFLNQDDYLVEKETEFILHYAGLKKPYFHNTGKYQYLWDENNFEKKNQEFISEIKHLSMLTKAALNNIKNAVLQTNHLNGHVLEFGCAKGGSAILISKFKRKNKQLKLFDVFGQIPPPTDNDEKRALDRYKIIDQKKESSNYYGYHPDLINFIKEQMNRFNVNNNVSYVKGKYEETLLELKEPISFAHIDCDWYESVKCVLKYVMPNLLVNGIVIIDDYNCWQGTNKAVDEYFKNIKDQFEFYFINKKLHIKRKKKTNKVNHLNISSRNILPINYLINNTIIDELYYNMYNKEAPNIDVRKKKKKKILTDFYNKNKDKFKNELLIIDYSYEGTEFTENINFMIDTLYNLSNKKIICLSANYLLNSNNIKYYNSAWNTALAFCNIINYNKTRKNNFLLLSGYTINPFRKNKLIILLYLFKEKILDKGIFSLTDIKNYNSSLQEHYISNKFSDLQDIEKKYFKHLKDISPKIIDIDPNNKKCNNSNGFSTKMIEIIKDTNFHIICETQYTDSSNNVCRYTEKITKILAIGSPFIVFGYYKVLELLHRDGFKTFSPFINEEYDLIDDLELRTQTIIKEINRLCGLSQLEWRKIHEKMIDIQKHNIINLKRLANSKDFIK